MKVHIVTTNGDFSIVGAYSRFSTAFVLRKDGEVQSFTLGRRVSVVYIVADDEKIIAVCSDKKMAKLACKQYGGYITKQEVVATPKRNIDVSLCRIFRRLPDGEIRSNTPVMERTRGYVDVPYMVVKRRRYSDYLPHRLEVTGLDGDLCVDLAEWLGNVDPDDFDYNTIYYFEKRGCWKRIKKNPILV